MKHLVDDDMVEVIVPDVVHDEVHRNRERILRQASASQKEIFKRVRAAMKQYGDGDTEGVTKGLLDVEHKLHIHGDAAVDTMAALEDLIRNADMVIPSTIARSRAANRGLDRMAPFASTRNGIADAVIFETYLEIMEAAEKTNDTFAFITSTTTDFADNTADKRQPHPHLAQHFDGKRSKFAIDLADFLKEVRETDDVHGMIDQVFDDIFFNQDPRLLSEVTDGIDLLWHQVWYNRHRHFYCQIEAGEITVMDEMPADRKYDPLLITKATLATSLAAGERVAKKYEGQLRPWDDFEWGMLNGKLSALRWVLGEEWDFLDT